jgi:glutamate dehydrogenase (NAD(P)+)
VEKRLDETMTAAFRDLWRVSQEKGLPLRTAAFMVALERVHRAHLQRGFD